MLSRALSMAAIMTWIFLTPTVIFAQQQLGAEQKLRKDPPKLQEQQKPTGEEGPGLKETLEWIKEKLEEAHYDAGYDEASPDITKYKHSFKFEFNDCNITYTKSVKSIVEYGITPGLPGFDRGEDEVCKVDLRDLKKNPAEDILQVGDADNDVWAVLWIGEDGCVEKEIFRNGQREKTESQDYISFTAVTHDMAERMAKAIGHAIGLCQKMPLKKSNELF